MPKHTPEFVQPQLNFDEIPYGYCHCGCGKKTFVSPRNHKTHGYVKGQPVRFVRGHHKRDYPSLTDTFWGRLQRGATDECWLWTGAKAKGYGKFVYDDTQYYAHRVAYELHYGPIPKGMSVLHQCDRPACCNWAHLFLGTQLDNIADMHTKGRHQHGEGTGCAKLTELDVLEIRRLHREGMSQADIAHQYGVTFQNVHSIVRYKNWRHIP